MTERTLCNLSNGMISRCDGADWYWEDMKKHCDSATKATHRHGCMFLREDARCDSVDAQDLAMKLMKK